MAALWNQFTQVVTKILSEGYDDTKTFTNLLAGAYSVATTPVSLKYSNGTITQPVLNAVARQEIIRNAFNKILNENGTKNSKLTPKDFLPAALSIIQYWIPGVGVSLSPLPAPAPCFAPILAGYPIDQDDLNAATEFANIKNLTNETDGGDIFKKLIKTSVKADPVVVFPSPIILFPGNPITLANDLHNAMTNSFSAQATAVNLTTAFQNHLSSIVGVYIGFKDPATPPTPLPFTIVVFKGIS